MRSSPSLLVVNRREDDAGDSFSQYRRSDMTSNDEIGITISISYKTLLLIFTLFGVFSRIVDALSNLLLGD
jgi:hypothetical protein